MRRSLLLLSLLAGCSTSSSQPAVEELPELKTILDAKPANGYQIILPIQKALMPATDTEVCTWTDLIVDHDIDVRSIESYQTVGGHHIIMFSTQKQQPPGTSRICTDDDMSTFRFGAGAGAEGMGIKDTAPGNLVFRIPAGSQIVLNHHYINATPNMIDAQSAMNIWLADPGTSYTSVGSMAILDTSMQVAPGASSLDINCTVQQTVNVWSMFPHMHQYGTRGVIQLTHAGVTQTMQDVQWTPSYTFHPPSVTVDPSQAFAVDQGDNLHMHCEWDNTTQTTMTFGLEMCVAFLQFVNSDNLDNMQCDHGQWGTF
ncbi:MAG TPA: hypothetical protein VN947_04050 [Polyangia bacterium]|nr:hypothetical protein [Polyangia bacterium]